MSAIDSGCTRHMTFDLSVFVTYKSVPYRAVELGNSESAEVMGISDVILNLNVEGTVRKCKLPDFYYVPGLGFSLLSVAKMDQKGCSGADRRIGATR